MAQDEKAKETAPIAATPSQVSPNTDPSVHYEEVSEYRIGEGPPPLALIIAFVLIVMWAAVSWIPFFGY